MSLSRILIVGTVLFSLPLAGCGGSRDPNALPTTPITVTVKYRGQPVQGATVTFIDSAAENPAFGTTDAEGKVEMSTYEPGDGVVYGSHKVTITKTMIANATEAADQDSPDYVPPAAGGDPIPVEQHLIPQKYSVPGSSGLSVEVTEDGPNEVTFDLVD